MEGVGVAMVAHEEHVVDEGEEGVAERCTEDALRIQGFNLPLTVSERTEHIALFALSF